MSGQHRCSAWRTEWSEDGGWVCFDCGKPYAPAPGGRTRDAREQIARWLWRHTGIAEDSLLDHADRLIAACPALADALAAVERVRALAGTDFDTDGNRRWIAPDLIRHVLDGEP